MILNQIQDQKKAASISSCHWNLNSITVHDFSKVTLLKAMAASSQYDICLSETFHDSTIKIDDERLNIEGCNLIRANQPGNKKGGGMYAL